MSAPPHDECPGPGETRRQAFAVADNLPHGIPITDDEVQVLDAWFGELLDELFGLGD